MFTMFLGKIPNFDHILFRWLPQPPPKSQFCWRGGEDLYIIYWNVDLGKRYAAVCKVQLNGDGDVSTFEPLAIVYIAVLLNICWTTYPTASIYDIFTYVYHKHQPIHVGKYTIHGWYGYGKMWINECLFPLKKWWWSLGPVESSWKNPCKSWPRQLRDLQGVNKNEFHWKKLKLCKFLVGDQCILGWFSCCIGWLSCSAGPILPWLWHAWWASLLWSSGVLKWVRQGVDLTLAAEPEKTTSSDLSNLQSSLLCFQPASFGERWPLMQGALMISIVFGCFWVPPFLLPRSYHRALGVATRCFPPTSARYPKMFYYASLSGKVPDSPGEEWFSWIRLSQKRVHEETGPFFWGKNMATWRWCVIPWASRMTGPLRNGSPEECFFKCNERVKSN